jgi:hypothetical protein
MPRSTRDCRAGGNARKGPSSICWVTFAIIAAHISRPDNVLRNDRTPAPRSEMVSGPFYCAARSKPGFGRSAVSRLLHDLDRPHVTTKPLWTVYDSLV